MAKTKRKLKVEFPEEKTLKKENKKDKEELEEILEEQVKIPTPNLKVSPTLELSENNLEAQVATAPEANTKNQTDEQKPLYESIKYSSNQSNYQENSYEAINFQPPDPSLSMNPLQQQDTFRNPMQGFRQANPFNPQGYPGMPEKNYETLNPNDNRKRRRM